MMADDGLVRVDDGVVWIGPGLATLAASFCRHCFGAAVRVPVSHWTGRARSNLPVRAFGIDVRLAGTMLRPQRLRLPGPRRLGPLAAEYVIAMREEQPVGQDSLMVGLVCALIFLELNDCRTRIGERELAWLAPRLATISRESLASRLGGG